MVVTKRRTRVRVPECLMSTGTWNFIRNSDSSKSTHAGCPEDVSNTSHGHETFLEGLIARYAADTSYGRLLRRLIKARKDTFTTRITARNGCCMTASPEASRSWWYTGGRKGKSGASPNTSRPSVGCFLLGYSGAALEGSCTIRSLP